MLTGTQTILRHFRWDDLEAAVAVINAEQAAIGNDYRYTVDELRRELDEPGFDAERDGFVITTAEGRVIGFADIVMLEDTGRVFARGYIHPDYQRQGLGSELVRATDAHALELTKHLPVDEPVYVQRADLDSNAGFVALMLSADYAAVRHFYRMMIEELPHTAPPLPEGFALRPFNLELDSRAVYETVIEAFRDHWGGDVAQPFDMWKHYTIEKPEFDPSLWMIVYDGEEIAGVCLCKYFGESLPDLGYVSTLAVRRPWRRRGLGEALLRSAFVMFRERGYTRVGLGVDGSSKTNAVALYERAGMTVFQRRTAYRKVLRGDTSKIAE